MKALHTANGLAATTIGFLALASASLNAFAQDVQPIDCILEPHMMIDLSSHTDGVANQVLADRSDIVKAGQVLAKLESSVEAATAQVARERAKLISDVRLQEVGVELYRGRQARTDRLFNKRAVALQVKEDADAEARLSTWKLRKARDEQHMATLERKRAEALLARRSVRSPVDGVVVQRMVEPGESVDDRPIFRIAQLNPLNVEVVLPVSMFGVIETGTWAQVSPEIGGSYQAQVKVVDRVVDAASGTFGVRLELPNPDYEIPAGLGCQVQFLTTMASNEAVAVKTAQ